MYLQMARSPCEQAGSRLPRAQECRPQGFPGLSGPHTQRPRLRCCCPVAEGTVQHDL